jgi:hypothetical protein
MILLLQRLAAVVSGVPLIMKLQRLAAVVSGVPLILL